MIELRNVCNIVADAANYVSRRRRERRLPATAKDSEHPRILNQEKNGIILFTWDDVTQTSKGAICTHVGFYDPTKKSHEVIWIYNQRARIVSCSINQGRSLLAFTVIGRDDSFTAKIPGKDVYSVFLAETQATSTRVFSLNLERQHFIKVQFLYDSQTSDRESHLMVMLHRESVGLYHIRLGRVGEKGVVMRDQPKTEQLIKRFFWCQWDMLHQRLYYLQYVKRGEGDKAHIAPSISCIQFYQNSQHDNILDIPIEFPFPHIKTSSKFHYSSDHLDCGIPDSYLNMVVLTLANGTFCICYQKMVSPYTVDRRSPVKRAKISPGPNPSPLSAHSLSDTDEETVDLNYYICMVHHAKTLHGCVTGLPYSRKYRLHFSWHGDYLMVLLPGHFVHLLNVGIEFEPCQHILLHERSIKGNITSIHRNVDSGVTMVTGNGESHDDSVAAILDVSVLSSAAEKLNNLSNTSLYEIQRDSPMGTCFYDNSSGEVWKVHVNMETLIQVFVHCYMSTTRAALLHYVLTRTRDFFLIKRLFEMLSNDIPSSEVPALMAEFLIVTTYSSMRRQFDREILKLVPFTASDTFRGQFEKSYEGERIARISYSPLVCVNIASKSAKDRTRKQGSVGDDLWDILRHHLRWMQVEELVRFSHESVKSLMEARAQSRNKEGAGQGTKSEDQFFFSSFHGHKSRSNRSESPAPGTTTFNNNMKRVRPDTVLGTAPPFLQGNNISNCSEMAMDMTKELFTTHLNKYLRKEARSKGHSVAKEYIACQIQQSRQLCHLLWNLRGPLLPYTDLDFLPNLTDPSSDDEYELFQLFERYYQTCQDLSFPLPQGFISYFTALGYRNLNTSLFLQYVDHGVLQLTGEFMAQVLADIQDTKEGVRMKQQIISRLPQNLAEECYREWNNPLCQRYFAHKQVSNILQDFNIQQERSRKLSDYSYMARDRSESSNSSLADVSFPPLASFLHYLETLDTTKPTHTQNPLDVNFLADVALYHTRKENKYDMSTVNF
ncbi:protein pigeon-like isoform X1 [Saccostrea echinata]|uniref:protein pigeon-like isoform X1 n=1 Tax=Saccostrea echinata TaxID=191078 RepID=UPI002A808ECC|nr:protein pigeon-like isoform X1 [Saccostrea echinata]